MVMCYSFILVETPECITKALKGLSNMDIQWFARTMRPLMTGVKHKIPCRRTKSINFEYQLITATVLNLKRILPYCVPICTFSHHSI